MPCLAKISGHSNQCLILEDPIARHRKPVTTERAIAWKIRNGISLLGSLLKRAVRKHESENQLQGADISTQWLEVMWSKEISLSRVADAMETLTLSENI